MKHFAVAINPTASFGKGKGVGPKLVSALEEQGYKLTVLTAPSFIRLKTETIKVLASGVDGLIVVGGDGMAHFAANLTAQTGTPFGIVPSGTGNDFAAGLGIPLKNPDAAISWLLAALEKEARVIDGLKIAKGSEHVAWVVSSLSAGFDAIVNERANLMTWPKGESRYDLAILRELIRLKPIKYQISVDDQPTQNLEAMLITVANNTRMGGGMLIAPGAKLDDGLLDLVIVKPLSRVSFLRIFPRVYRGTHITDPRVIIQRAKKVTIFAEKLVAYADGERITTLPLSISLEPGAFRVFTDE